MNIMEQIKKFLGKSAIVMLFLLGSCAAEPEVSKGVGEYLLYSEKRLAAKDFEIILKVEHIEGERYAFKEYYGEKLIYDNIFIIKGIIVYDLGETGKMGEFTSDFKTYKKGIKNYNREL